MESLAGQEITVRSIKARKEEMFAVPTEAENLNESAEVEQDADESDKCGSGEGEYDTVAAESPGTEVQEVCPEQVDMSVGTEKAEESYGEVGEVSAGQSIGGMRS